MFSRSNPVAGAVAKFGKPGPSGLSFIGPEATIGGDFVTTAQLHVDGRIEGNVRCAGLCQGASGVVAGDIVADEARLAGLVEGTVNAGTLFVEATARITGDVTYETISIAAGGRIDGRLARREALVAADTVNAVLIATPTEPEPAPKPGDGSGLFAGLASKKKAAVA